MNLELKSIPSWLNLLSMSFYWVMETALLKEDFQSRLLDVHGYSTYKDTIIPLHMVKDELLHVFGGLVSLMNFWAQRFLV